MGDYGDDGRGIPEEGYGLKFLEPCVGDGIVFNVLIRFSTENATVTASMLVKTVS